MTYLEADTAYRAAHASYQIATDAFLAGKIEDAAYFAAKAVFAAASDALDAAEADLPEIEEFAAVVEADAQLSLI
jgi:hypothetical protein